MRRAGAPIGWRMKMLLRRHETVVIISRTMTAPINFSTSNRVCKELRFGGIVLSFASCSMLVRVGQMS